MTETTVIRSAKAQVQINIENGDVLNFGRVQDFKLTVGNETEEVGEVGNDNTVEIVEGVEKVSGTFTVKLQNLNAIKLAASRGVDGSLPYLEMHVTIPLANGSFQEVTVYGGKLNGFDLSVGLSTKVMSNTLNFKACRYLIN